MSELNRDKQIEKLTQDLFQAYGINKLYTEDVAEYLYDAGYRKASEVAREIFEEIEAIKVVGTFPIGWVKNFAELKKKYTEEGK